MEMDYSTYLVRKKKKRKTGYVIALTVFLALLGIGLFFYQRKKGEGETDGNDRAGLVLTQSQSFETFEIEEIAGNDIITTQGRMLEVPVGTDVVTRLGSVTTFSRLAAGDRIVCLMEKDRGEDIILKIWMDE